MSKKNRKSKQANTIAEGNQTVKQVNNSHFDPNGSWTGVPDNPLKTPEQDADDL